MSVIGEAILSAIIEELVKEGFQHLVGGCTWRSSIKSELGDLENHDLPRIKAVVKATESGDERLAGDEHLQEWLRVLKDALYEADDVLDELKYLELQKQVEVDHRMTEEAATGVQEQHGHCSQLKVRALMKRSVSKMKSAAANFSCGRVFQSHQTLRKLREVIQSLSGVAGSPDLANFYNMVKDAKGKDEEKMEKTINKDRVTTAVQTEPKVYGRVEEKQQIIQWLMRPEDDVQLRSVVGHGGMGKTTLAKFVLEDKSVRDSFEPVMWAYVSPTFDLTRIIKQMLAYTKAKKPEFDNLDGLQATLMDSLKTSAKKFLLVLDDAWEDQNLQHWQDLLAPLRCAAKGGRILLTTRSAAVAQMAKQTLDQSSSSMIINLSGLGETEYLELFNRYAFSGKDENSYPQLLSIGKEIASNLGGSPLVAKVIGSMLNKKVGDTEYWRNVRDHRIRGDNIIMSNLRLSYHYLPSELRPCFAYCSVLPRRKLRKQDVVRMWMAVGLIQDDSSGESMESKGGRYYDELLGRSILESININDDPYFNMHDLLYELACSVAGGECFALTDDKQVEQIPKNIRHLHLQTRNPEIILKMEVDKLKSLRTLIVDFPIMVTPIMNKIFESLGSIRVLVVGSWEGLPNAIGGSTHLRYLQVVGEINGWPQWLSKLYNLQTLRLDVAGGEPDIKGLISLRHWEPLQNILATTPGVGKLTSLQELKFRVRQETGFKIGQLKGLAQLRELSVVSLENVRSPEEAKEARICEKKHMRTLSLSWGSKPNGDDAVDAASSEDDAVDAASSEDDAVDAASSEDDDVDAPLIGDDVAELQEKVLEELKPNSSLEKLTINNYEGIKHPGWLDAQSLKDITRIKLTCCSRLVQLSPLGNLKCLARLHLEEMPGVKRICPLTGFQNLQVLKMVCLEQLEQWDDGSETEGSPRCPRLVVLDIARCPKLVVLPSLPPSLRYLFLDRLPIVKQIDFEGSLPKLEKLEFNGMEQLEKLCGRGVNDGSQCFYPSLRRLLINGCGKLNALPALPLCLEELYLLGVGLTSLPKLWVGGNGEESSVSASSPSSSSSQSSSLSNLSIDSCPILKSLANGLLQQQHHLQALSSLAIIECGEIMSLPAGGFRHLCSLQRMTLFSCPKLQLQPDPETASSSADHDGYLIPSSLESLEIINCGSIGRSLPRFLAGASSLSKLRLLDCSDVTSLPGADVMATLVSLRKLTIAGCHELTSLGGLSVPLRLDFLEIDGCPKLLPQPRAATAGAALPMSHDYEDRDQHSFAVRELSVGNPLLLLVEPLRNLTSVEELRIGGCGPWGDIQSLVEVDEWLLRNRTSLASLLLWLATSLPTCIQSLSSLRALDLFWVSELQSLPQLPSSLRKLEIWGCNEVLKERLQRDTGADWPHIQHISHITIG